MKFNIYILALLASLLIYTSCRKGPGLGGNATITGKVYEYDYNSDFTNLKDAYFKADQDVYIVYGDEKVYADKFSTHYDGTFQFNYLLPGEYTIYAYSKDTTDTSAIDMVVEKKIVITDRWETIETDTLIIYN